MHGALVVIAHPDDEVFISGTLCLLVERGLPIEVLAVTSGEDGSKSFIQPAAGLSLAGVRRRELELSAAVLGASRVSFLDQPDVRDPLGGGLCEWDLDAISVALAARIRETKPAVVFTHGPIGGHGHKAHQAVFQCVSAAVVKADYEGSLYSFCGRTQKDFFTWHLDQKSDVLIDVRQFNVRRAVSLCYHQSQIEFFLAPRFPNTARKLVSAMIGYILGRTEYGRRRIPIGSAGRFFARVPNEGIVLQRGPRESRPHYFLENYATDKRVTIVA